MLILLVEYFIPFYSAFFSFFKSFSSRFPNRTKTYTISFAFIQILFTLLRKNNYFRAKVLNSFFFSLCLTVRSKMQKVDKTIETTSSILYSLEVINEWISIEIYSVSYLLFIFNLLEILCMSIPKNSINLIILHTREEKHN